MSKLDNIKPNRSTTNAHSKSTIRSLLKEIFKLIITIGNLGISYIEDWSRVLLKSAIDSRDTKVIDDVVVILSKNSSWFYIVRAA